MWTRFTAVVVSLLLVSTHAGNYQRLSYLQQVLKVSASSDAANRSGILEAFLQKLWNLDSNRLEVGRDLKINEPSSKRIFSFLPNKKYEKLFTYVNWEKVRRPTYLTFIDLLDNYRLNASKVEYTTRARDAESWRFIDAIMETRVMQLTHRFLVEQNLAPHSVDEFKGMLHEMWFEFHRPRWSSGFGKGKGQFSAFEHVFVGEHERSGLTGYHSWIQLMRQEADGTVKMMQHRGQACEENPHFIKVAFQYPSLNLVKDVASVLLGTSPEFEIGAYTAVFLMGVPGHLSVNGCSIYLFCTHQFHEVGRPSSCYPRRKLI